MIDGHERAILELLAAHGDGLGWHAIAVRLGARGQHDPRNLVHVLDGLTGRGLLAAADGRWTLTELGRATLG
jgi:hypothetical protein